VTDCKRFAGKVFVCNWIASPEYIWRGWGNLRTGNVPTIWISLNICSWHA